MAKYSKNLQILDVRVNHLSEGTMSHEAPGVVIGTAHPVFSWRLSCGSQRACRMAVATTRTGLASPDCWDSGWCASANSLAFPYGGRPLHSREHLFFQVSVESTDGETAQSGIGEFAIALLEPEDWRAKWIYADGFEHLAPAPAPIFRRKITIPSAPRQAMLYSSARGLLELYLNGRRVDGHDFLPGWSDFHKEAQYTAYDVTPMLKSGDNVIAALLGDGWYAASLPGYRRELYGTVPAMLLQLELSFADGSSCTVTSDNRWHWRYGAILSSDIYDGECYNAQRLDARWLKSDFDDTDWKSALESAVQGSAAPRLIWKQMPGVRRQAVLEPVSRKVLQDGVWLYDFGRIITGRVRLAFTASPMIAGLRGRLRYGEVLNRDGSLYNVNFRSADNIDTYVASEGKNSWESHFTFHGFRYVQLEVFSIAGYGITDLTLEAVELTSDLPKTGEFTCGYEPINQLARNIENSMHGNFLEIPMDCPQRDERLGWSGDAHLFMPTAMFLADGRLFYRKYLHDLAVTQREDGAICSVAPAVPGFQYGSTGWADALPVMAWELYQQSGDRSIVEEHYPAIKRYLAYQQSQANDLILPGHPDHLSLADTPVDTKLIGTLFFMNTARIASSMAKVLGDHAEAQEFQRLAQDIRAAFRRAFLDDDGVLREKTQSGFALLFHFEVLESPMEKERNAACFRKLFSDSRNHLNTGFIGTAYLCTALVKAGLADVACDLLLQKEYPSWLFEVEQGATTIWERWDSFHPEKGFADPLMNSFNHYANGAVGEFLFGDLAGVRFHALADGQVSPHIEFHIIPDARIGSARAVLQTPCGTASSEWQIIGNNVHWKCLVPPNTVGHLKNYPIEPLYPGTHDFVLSLNP